MGALHMLTQGLRITMTLIACWQPWSPTEEYTGASRSVKRFSLEVVQIGLQCRRCHSFVLANVIIAYRRETLPLWLWMDELACLNIYDVFSFLIRVSSAPKRHRQEARTCSISLASTNSNARF